MPAILEVQNLVKKYGDLAAVKGISFSVMEGEIFSLLGPNGAGKSTTISVLSTLFPPTSGEATVCGHSVTREPMAVKRSIGVVPQEIALYEDLTALENLQFWGQMYGLSGKALSTRVGEVLEQIGLQDKAKARIKTYSGGMKRRVNIGVGLLQKPRLLFMDEPTVGIDPQSRRAILDSVKALNREGMTILYTTHYMEEAQELSDRVGIIDHGELIALGTQAELTRQVGGIIAETHWEWLYISLMFLPEDLRGQGFGQRLLSLAEAEARSLGAKHAYLDTFSFQALGFYQKYGYEVFGSLQDFPPGHQRYYMQKEL